MVRAAVTAESHWGPFINYVILVGLGSPKDDLLQRPYLIKKTTRGEGGQKLPILRRHSLWTAPFGNPIPFSAYLLKWMFFSDLWGVYHAYQITSFPIFTFHKVYSTNFKDNRMKCVSKYVLISRYVSSFDFLLSYVEFAILVYSLSYWCEM